MHGGKGFLREHLVLILPVFGVLFIAVCIAYLSISVDAPRISVVPFFQEREIKTTLINVLLFVSIASLSIPFLYFTLKKGWVSLLERMFATGGGLLTLFLSGILSLQIFELFPSFLVDFLVWLCNFFIAFSIAFTVTGLFSEETRNVMFIMYSSVAGIFLGMGIPMFSMVHILFSLCIIDLVSYRAGILQKIGSLSDGEAIFVRLRYSDRELTVGLGDLIYYSMLASYSLANFGILTAVFSTFLILIGWILTFFYTMKREIFPGLPIPFGLGLIPIVIKLISFLI